MEGPTQLHQLAVVQSEWVARRDAALAVLSARTGVAVPTITPRDRPKPLPVWIVADLAVDATLAELILALAGEIDALRTEIDGLKAAPVSAGNGATKA